LLGNQVRAQYVLLSDNGQYQIISALTLLVGWQKGHLTPAIPKSLWKTLHRTRHNLEWFAETWTS